MKVKLNFDLKAIQAFLLAHVEKFVFGLVILVFLSFISGAMKRTGYDKTPQELNEVATRAEKNIESTPPPEPQYPNPKWKPKAERLRDPIEVIGYRYDNLWLKNIWEQRPTRKQPLLYTVEDLQGAAGHGAVRVKLTSSNPLTAGGVIGRRWVVITGLIPYQRQVEAYEEAFAKAEFHDPGRDIPKVAYYRLERKELTSPGEATQAPWTPLNLRSRLTVLTDLWNGNTSGVVNAKYIHQGEVTPIAFPLPPLDSGSFGREVAHDPEIPLAVEETTAPAEPTPAAAAEEKPKADDKPPDLPPGLRPEAPVEQQVAEAEPLPYRLFRFFDFEVEPGKHYQYRVRLMLANPNWQVERQYLAEDSLREDQYLDTEWSQPSEVISVPRDARVLLGSVRPAPGGRVTSEPRATVGISYFFFPTGDELFDRSDVYRGKFLNLPGHKLPKGIAAAGVAGAAGGTSPAGGNGGEAENAGPPTVDFNTETVLLDIEGGERLPGRDRDLTSPGKVLLLDPYGNLVIRDELDDKPAYDKYPPPEVAKKRREKAKKPAAGEEEEAPEDMEPPEEP